MTDRADPTAPATWVAIDVAKGCNVALIEHHSGRRQRFRFTHCREDYDNLVSVLRAASAPCQVGLEPTGDYHRTLAYRLLTEGFEVVLVSSVAGARMREAVYNSWDKNDPKDASVILRLMQQGLILRYCDPVHYQTHDLQELAKTYQHIGLARSRLQHALLNHYLTLYWPELERFWSSQHNDWFIRLLLRFPVPTAVTALPLPDFIAAAWTLVGRRVHKQAKLEEIYDLASHSIGLPIGEDSPAVGTFRLQLQRYLTLNEERQRLEIDAHTFLAERADYRHLRTLPGVGPIIALVILAEGGDLRRFGHYRQFLKYCGLDLAKSQSGSSRSRERLSKRGNARLRCALWMAAVSAVRMRENAFRDKYQRYVAQDPDDPDLKRKARTAVTAKLARTVYALIKNDCDYQPRFEQRLPSGSIPLKRAVEATRTS